MVVHPRMPAGPYRAIRTKNSHREVNRYVPETPHHHTVQSNRMVTMALKNRRRTRGPPGSSLEPSYNFRFVVVSLLGFMVAIRLAVVLSSIRKKEASRKRNDVDADADANADQNYLNHHNHRLFSNPDQIPRDILKKLDAILVLGGGVPDSLNVPPIYVQKRADDAAKVVENYRKVVSSPSQSVSKNTTTTTLEKNPLLENNPLPILCLSAGTAHLPQLLGPDGLPIWESTSCAAYLAERHHLVDNVFVETTSYDTIGNAFFTRTSHTDVNGWRRLLVITNEFHMSRTAAIFDWIFLQCSTSSRKDDKWTTGYEVYYLSSDNFGLSEEAITARREREDQSAKNVRENLAKKYTTMAMVWKFLNSEHALYTASKLVERGQGAGLDAGASEMVKKSYGLKGAAG